ncbi:hypothetical protein ACFLWB_00150 [Chloroflexota bacterium]
MTIWLITDVDTEFDCLRLGYKDDWRRDNPGLTKGVGELLRFFGERGIRATFHIQEQKDPDLSILVRYPEVLSAVEEYGQEISLHVHVKETDYLTRRVEISTAFQRLKEHGYKVTTFKAGWYFTNENTIRVLEELGIKYDCSPFKNISVGPMNWFNIPDSPYHPSYEDITKAGDARILMIPITNRRLGITINKNEDYELELMKKGVRALVSVSEQMEQPVIIYFTTHSWKPIEVNTTSIREWERERRKRFFDFLLQFPIKSLTVSEAGLLWEQERYEPYQLKLPDILGSLFQAYRPSHYFGLTRWISPKLTSLKYKIRGKL